MKWPNWDNLVVDSRLFVSVSLHHCAPLRVESLYLTLADAGPGGQLLPKTWNHTVHGSV
jgi:hypothetical protein